MIKLLKLLFIFTLLTNIVGCSSSEKNLDTPEGLFELAKKFENSDRYQASIQRYNELRTRFPYSSYAVQAELAIADVHYKNQDFAEAQISYQNFRELHPKHAQIDYVVYQIGMSYYEQLPETFDRDISLANDAIYNFNDLIKRFPNSEHLIKAKEYREKAFIMLNEKELYIADFYFKQKQYDSALNRYESAITKYPGFGLEPRGLAGAIRSAHELNLSDKQQKYSSKLTSEFSESDEANQIKKEGL